MRRNWIFLMMAVFTLSLLATTACECEDSRVSATLAELSAEPDPVDFGEVPVSTVREMDVTLTNRGTATVIWVTPVPSGVITAARIIISMVTIFHLAFQVSGLTSPI